MFELMIVLTIMGLLVALVMPNYTDSVRKGRRADAQAKLREFESFAARRFTVDSSYECFADDTTTCPPPPSDDFYTFTVTGVGQLTYTVTATPTEDSGQDNDPCGTMSLNQASYATAGDTDCW